MAALVHRASLEYQRLGFASRAATTECSTRSSAIATLGVQFSSHVRRARIRQDSEFFDSVRQGYEFLSQPENRDHPLAGIISGLEVYHLHGGGYLNNRWPTHGFMVGLGLAATELTGCRLVATGLGLGPLEAPEADDTLSIVARSVSSTSSRSATTGRTTSCCRTSCTPLLHEA